jgi:hypothetical protein
MAGMVSLKPISGANQWKLYRSSVQSRQVSSTATTLSADEVVVKAEGTAHLMNSQAIKDIISFGNKVVPTTWMTSMEFAVVPAGYVVFLQHF